MRNKSGSFSQSYTNPFNLSSVVNNLKHCSGERGYLCVYGSKYSTKAKECDVETVQKPLEDKEMYSVQCISVPTKKHWNMGVLQIERQKNIPGK